MTTKKISELSTVPSLDGSETWAILKGGFNYKMTLTQLVNWIGNATASLAGFMSPADKSKLDGIEAGATANALDADLRDRSTHTGTQSATTIDGLADVATSGDYADLTGAPSLAAVAESGAYADLSGRPIDANLMRIPALAFQAAAGTTGATATPITKTFFHVSTADASNTGIILPAAMTLGTMFILFNGTATTLQVYPADGGQINYAGVNVPFALAAYAPLRLVLIDAANGVYQQV